MTMRPLTLHVSALSDSEYALYTASLNDLTTDSSRTTHVRDDARYEQTSVGIREARAWLRGRYSDLPAFDIDAILKLFFPNMSPTDTLTGGQFFAALRLVVHAESGKGIDRTLAFVQASPRSTKAPESARPVSPPLPKWPIQAPPSHPDRPKPAPPATSFPETNPFTRRPIENAMTPAPAPLADSEPTSAPVIPQHHHRPSKISQNPFIARDKTEPPPANVPNHGKLPPLPPRKPALLAAPPRRASEAVPTPSTSTAGLMVPPGLPLIPTKSTHVSPLMRQSLEASKHAQSMKRAEEQLDRERVLQVLKTSSSSSSTGIITQNAKTRTRSLSPFNQDQSQKPLLNGHRHDPGSASGSVESDDATCVPPLPQRRKPSRPPSSSGSLLSLEQVASATLPSPVATPHKPPPLPSRDVLGLGVPTTHADHTGLLAVAGPGPAVVPPPRHPRRRPSTSTEPNVNDSQSSSSTGSSPLFGVTRPELATSTAPSALPPPPRRKRPESMQLPSTPGGPYFPPSSSSALSTAHAHARTTSFQQGMSGSGLSRQLSLTRREREQQHELSESSMSSPIANLQKTLASLQMRAQPKLDAVRYKAEAGISRRGYVHHGREEEGERGLMADTRRASANIDWGPYDEPTTDDEPSSAEDRSPARSKATTTAVTAASDAHSRDFLTESDNLKWPMGEGWKLL